MPRSAPQVFFPYSHSLSFLGLRAFWCDWHQAESDRTEFECGARSLNQALMENYCPLLHLWSC
ncbi:MAG: hypothetical protein ICV63_05035 [Coleofasciculus sp. Co-bin14]|nr:hypothetical protein [Coleofasciculus sp. Co-bin14]